MRAVSAEAKSKSVEVYDFRRPTTLAREHSRVLEAAFDTFARQWGTQLTAKVRARSQVTFEHVMMTTYSDYTSSLPTSTAMTLVSVEDNPAKASIQFDTAAALGWFNRMLGGDGAVPSGDHKFTPIELTLLRRLIDDIVEDLQYSLGPLVAGPLSFDSVHHNSQFAQGAGTNELMIVSRYSIQVGDADSEATVAIPADAVLQQLGTTNPVVKPQDLKALINHQLADVPVDASLSLQAVTTTPERVLRLGVGDIIHTSHPVHRPLNVTVGGQQVATAAIGTSGPRLAFIVTETQEKNQ